jgi:hypothetical protein
MKFINLLFLAVVILTLVGCSTPNKQPYGYRTEVISSGYGETYISYGSEEERNSMLGFVKKF